MVCLEKKNIAKLQTILNALVTGGLRNRQNVGFETMKIFNTNLLLPIARCSKINCSRGTHFSRLISNYIDWP